MRPTRRRAVRRGRFAFTLPELLVAIGVVALVVVGIGRVFQSVGDLVGTGEALSQVDQMARTIEKQMREDFAALNRMAAADTFIAIRMRELGDVDRDGTLDGDPAMPGPGDERAIYISLDDREADEQDILNGFFNGPYEEGSRAITTRLDEIMFLARSERGYESAQFTQDMGDDAVNSVLRARHARIYYGHALRPAPDPEWPPEDPTAPDAPRVPRRQFIADGDFGQTPGEDNRFTEAFGSSSAPNSQAGQEVVSGRNEYAGDWLLARHVLLLAGGDAAGPHTPPQGFPANERLIGEDIEFAPYIRDINTLHRIWPQLTTSANGDFDHAGPSSTDVEEPVVSDPRLIYHGRVDVSAQGLDDVRRWLEGEPGDGSPTAAPGWSGGEAIEATPFSAGLLNRTDPSGIYGEWPMQSLQWDPTPVNSWTAIQRFLWQRAPNMDFLTDSSLPDARDRLAANLRGLNTAIAGCFMRPLAESSTPRLDRRMLAPGAAFPPDPPNAQEPIDPEDALMDSHAVIAEHCSRFEIAWTDGSTVREAGGVDPDLRQGDLVWFDITPPDPDNRPDFRATYRQMWEEFGQGVDPEIQFASVVPSSGASTMPIPPDADYWQVLTLPELGYTDWRNPDPPFPAGPNALLRMREDDQTAPDTNGGLPVYNPDITAGADDGQKEYFAIWPFRVPDVAGEYSRPWPKNLLIRIRMTLHDTQRRLEGGKEFEFIFRVDLADN